MAILTQISASKSFFLRRAPLSNCDDPFRHPRKHFPFYVDPGLFFFFCDSSRPPPLVSTRPADSELPVFFSLLRCRFPIPLPDRRMGYSDVTTLGTSFPFPPRLPLRLEDVSRVVGRALLFFCRGASLLGFFFFCTLLELVSSEVLPAHLSLAGCCSALLGPVEFCAFVSVPVLAFFPGGPLP